MSAVAASHPDASPVEEDWNSAFMSASLDHAMWFHRPAKADDWVLMDMTGHGMLRTRGLATGPMFRADGTHLATVAQEGLMRQMRAPRKPACQPARLPACQAG
jgi:acyl-CoA thioesterase-2